MRPTPRRSVAFALTLSAAAAALPALPSVFADDVDPVDPIEDQALREEAAAKFDEALATFEKAFGTAIAEAEKGGDAKEKNLARAEVLLEKIAGLAETTSKHGETERSLAKYDSGRTGSLLGGQVTMRRAEWKLAEGDAAGAEELAAGLGLVRDWWLLGPFDNERGAKFKEKQSVEQKIDFGASFLGKDQRKLAWRRVPVKQTLGYVDLDALMNPNDQAYAYVAAFVKSETEQDAAVRVGSDEALKVWVNGAEIVSRDIRRTMGFDQDVAGVRLAAGWNVILMKVHDQTGSWGFRARLTTPDGASLRGVAFAANDAEAAEAAAAGTKALEPKTKPDSGAKAWYDAAAAKEQKKARDLFHLGLLHHLRDYDSVSDRKAENLLREAAEAEPGNAIYRFHYAEAAAPPAEIAAEKEENRQRQGREKTLEIDPRHALAHRALASYYASSLLNLEKAETHLRLALEANKDFVEARLDLASVLERRGLAAQAEIERQAAYASARASGLETAARVRAQIADRNGLGRDAAAAWKDVLKIDARSADVSRRVAELAAQSADRDEAAKILDALAASQPFETSHLLRKAEIQEGAGDLEAAAATLRRALEIAPQDDRLHEKLGRVLGRNGDRDGALAAYRKSLELNPKDQALERYVEFLDPAAAPFEDDWQFDATALVEKAAGWKNDENDGWLVVLDHSVTKVNKDGTSATFTRSMVKVLNDAGVKAFDRVFAQGFGALKWKWARVTKADGSVVDAKIRGNSADMPTLAAGDVVDWAYRFDEREQSYFGDYFGTAQYFADQVPVLLSRFTLVTPAERKFLTHQKNFDAKPEITMHQDGAIRAYTWENRDVAKRKSEPLMPGPRESYPQVQVTTYESWDQFAKWWAGMIREQRIMSPEMKDKLAALVKDKESRQEKIRAVYEWVADEITYQAWPFGVHGYKPYTTTAIFDKKEGDCKDKALLICTMLGEIGIEAHPVLIYADQGRDEDDLTLPMVQQFNHCIAWVPDADGKGTPMFLDGTAQYHSSASPPMMDRGAKVLVVTPEGGKIMKIAEGNPDDFGIDQSWNVTVNDDGSAVAEGEFRWKGDLATQIRSQFSVEGQRKLELQKLMVPTFGSAKLESFEFDDLKDLRSPVAVFRVKASVPKFAKPQGEQFALPTRFLDLLQLMRFDMLVSRPERDHDLVLPISPAKFTWKATYTLPANWTVESRPADTNLDIAGGAFTITTSAAEPRKVTFERTWSWTKTRVSPAEYGAFREQFSKAFSLSAQTIQAKKSAAPAEPSQPAQPAAPETPK
ncbi:MAG: hypothetical protein HMLKMBBP_02903 [Planctomycetes bacterium]|nr:hypothetical protein [Planctomycetota bacterium]